MWARPKWATVLCRPISMLWNHQCKIYIFFILQLIPLTHSLSENAFKKKETKKYILRNTRGIAKGAFNFFMLVAFACKSWFSIGHRKGGEKPIWRAKTFTYTFEIFFYQELRISVKRTNFFCPHFFFGEVCVGSGNSPYFLLQTYHLVNMYVGWQVPTRWCYLKPFTLLSRNIIFLENIGSIYGSWRKSSRMKYRRSVPRLKRNLSCVDNIFCCSCRLNRFCEDFAEKCQIRHVLWTFTRAEADSSHVIE